MNIRGTGDREKRFPGDRVAEEDEALMPSWFTPQEWDVLQLVAQGSTTIEVAEALDIDRDTVRELIESILIKLGEHGHGVAFLSAATTPLPTM